MDALGRPASSLESLKTRTMPKIQLGSAQMENYTIIPTRTGGKPTAATADAEFCTPATPLPLSSQNKYFYYTHARKWIPSRMAVWITNGWSQALMTFSMYKGVWKSEFNFSYKTDPQKSANCSLTQLSITISSPEDIIPLALSLH